MGENIKLDASGTCGLCQNISRPNEHVECYMCKGHFHVICPSVANENKVATKTTVTNFLLGSTKNNFLFFCDCCLTQMEIKKVETETNRVNVLEKKMEGVDTKLAEIMTLLNAQTRKTKDAPQRENLWNNKERLETVRAPEPKARLVISKESDAVKNLETRTTIEKVLIENAISLAETHQNKVGDLVLTCESKAAREELKQLVQTANKDIVMSSPNIKQKSITIVGLPYEYTKDEVLKCIVTQNGFINQFATLNKIEDHIKIHVIKPLRNKPNTFQVFASVSPVLREGILHHKDKLIIGIVSCKIYDRQQLHRCNNCQHFGHFAKSCPTPNEPFCAKCSGNHRTDGCTSDDRKCINCVRKNEADVNHSVFYHGCPTTVKYLELKATSLNQGQRDLHPT